MNFANKMQIIQKIVQSEKLVTAYNAATNMPLIDCSSETFNDRAFAFENEELMKTFIKPWADRKMPLKGIIFLKKDRMRFFTTLASIGIDELVYVEKTGVHVIKLSDIIKKQDMSKIPVQARPVENPQLQMSGIYFIQEAARGVPAEEKKDLKELEEELSANIVKGTYLMPIILEQDIKESAGQPGGPGTANASGQPENTGTENTSDMSGNPDAAGNTDAEQISGQSGKPAQEGSIEQSNMKAAAQIAGQKQLKFKIPLLKDPKGNVLQPVFTDNIELAKYAGKNQLKVLKVPFAGLEKLLAKEAAGYILNPAGFHLNISRAQLGNLKMRFPDASVKQAAPADKE